MSEQVPGPRHRKTRLDETGMDGLLLEDEETIQKVMSGHLMFEESI